MLGDQGPQQVAVFGRMTRHEGGAEAGGERRLRLLAQALFRTGHLGGEAGQEVIHGLAGGQPGDGRQHAKGIGRQHDDILGVSRPAGGRGVGDVIDRIGGAGIFRVGRVVQVQRAGGRVHHHIFQHRAEAFGGRENLRLRLAAQLDDLGIAAAFDVEDAVFAPAMLVIADQRARRIGRQRGLAGTGKPEKDRRLAVRANIGGAVHAHHPFGRQQVVHDGEDRLLHLASIGGAADQDHFLVEVYRDHGLAGAAMTRRIGIEAGQVDDGEFRIEALQLFGGGPDQKLVHEQRVPGEFGDHSYRNAMREIGTAEQILGEQLAPFGMGHHVGMERIEMRGAHRLVVVPPDLGFGGGVAHHKLVRCRASGMHARAHHQRTILGNHAFAAAHRFFVQGRRAEIEVHALEVAKAVAGKAKSGVGHAGAPKRKLRPL